MINAIRNELNKCFTENGDTAYRSTFNANLDLFGVSGALRHNQNDLIRLVDNAINEDTILAIKNIFYMRDVRGGLGERLSFRNAFRILIKNDFKLAEKLLPLIPEIGRYDDLFVCVDTPLEGAMISLIRNQLKEDVNNNTKGESVSLLAKWLPSVNASNANTVALAKKLAKKLGMNERTYRKTLSALRKGRIIENNLREKDYSFKYSAVPSVAMHKYRNAFLKNDGDRYVSYLNDVNNGVEKINTGALYPYQVIKEFKWNMSENEKLAMQVKWDNFKNNTNGGKTIVVRDGSGSMTCYGGLPMDIATSLAILFAEKLEGEFHNKFITFSSNPELVELKGNNLYENLNQVYRYNDISNTNIEKVYNLILNAASSRDFNRDEMIERIVIISDMEFDQGVAGVPNYEVFEQKFKALGYKMPEVVFWNVNARRVHFAAKADQPNIRLVSGASASVIDAILENRAISAEEQMLETLSKYDYLNELLA